jgi:hypothetical protein
MPSAPSLGRDLYIDTPLSNLVVSRRPDGFIADQLVPVTTVGKQTGVYYTYDHLESRQHEVDLTARAPDTESRKVHFTVSSNTYSVKNYALGTTIPVEDVANADDVLDWANTQALFLADRIQFDFEKRVAALARASTSVHTVTNVATAWSNRTGSRPFDDLVDIIENYRQVSGTKPNRVIIPETIMSKLRANDQFRDILYGDRGGLVSAEQIASLIGVDQVLVPMSQVNTFGETETINGSASLADVWGDQVILANVNMLQGRFTDTWLSAFRWTAPELGGFSMAVKRFPFDAKRKSFSMEIDYYQSEQIISSDLAWIVQSLV